MQADTVKLVDTEALATVIGVSVETIKSWARRGLIPSLRVGSKTLRFNVSDVLAAMERQGECGHTRRQVQK